MIDANDPLRIEPMAGARYGGVRNISYANGSEALHVVIVDHPNGPWDAVFCKTEWQAREIVRSAELRTLQAENERLKKVDESFGEYDH